MDEAHDANLVSDILKSYAPPGNPAIAKQVEWVRNPDGTTLRDHNGQPVSVDRILATKPLKGELSTRPGPGNKKLTYMSGEGVTRTLNDVFGYDGWNLEIKRTNREECMKDDKGRFQVAYTATVRLTHRKSGSFKEDVGAGDSIDRNMGTAISHALKASITDAMKRAARHFGDKLGNSLYQGNFNVNKAPRTLKEALDQAYIERANTKFGFPKDQSKDKVSNANSVKSEFSSEMVQNAKQGTTNQQDVERDEISRDSSRTACMLPPNELPSNQPKMPPPFSATKKQHPVQTKDEISPKSMQTPKSMQVPKSMHPEVMPLVTPANVKPPPTPGQGLLSSNLFGLGAFVAGSAGSTNSYASNASRENQLLVPSIDSNRPGTSTGVESNTQQGAGPFSASRQNAKREADFARNYAQAPPKKPNIMAAQRNPYLIK